MNIKGTPEWAKLHEFQQQTVTKMVAANRWLANHETGLGKTPCAILAARWLEPNRMLVVCPALVRQNWLSEFDKWWPGHPTIASIDCGWARKLSKKKAAERDLKRSAPIQIVSYALLSQIELKPWNIIIWDEIHRLQSPSSHCSRFSRVLRDSNPEAARFGLTATIMPDQPKNAWQPLDMLFPNQFGRPHKHNKYISWWFANRYCLQEQSQYGISFYGVNPEHSQELQEKMRSVSSRTTKAEVAHLLPALTVQKLAFPQDANMTEALEDWMADCQQTTTHIALLSYRRETARQLSEKFGGLCITGEFPPDVRYKMLEEAKKRSQCVLCATMDSINEGIDLTKFSHVAVIEMVYSPKTIIQVLGRFSRLSGKVPSNIYLLVQSGSKNEMIATKLCHKIDAVNAVVKPGQADNLLSSALALPQLSDDAFRAECLSAIENTSDFVNDDFMLDPKFDKNEEEC